MDVLHDQGADYAVDTRPFDCTFDGCLKSFARKSDLVRHERIHNNERPWICDWPGCKRDFIQRSALIVHQRTHTGERPHRCEIGGCDKAFSDSSSLARHRRIHTGQRPYHCTVATCLKDFCRKTTLTKHIKRNHPEWAHDPDAVSIAVFDNDSLEDYLGSATPEEYADDYGVARHERGGYQLPAPPTPYGFESAPETPEIPQYRPAHPGSLYAPPNEYRAQAGSPGARSASGDFETSLGRQKMRFAAPKVQRNASYHGPVWATPPPSLTQEVRRSKRNAAKRRYNDELSEDDAGGQMLDQDDDDYTEGQAGQRAATVGHGRRQLLYTGGPYPQTVRASPRLVFVPPPSRRLPQHQHHQEQPEQQQQPFSPPQSTRLQASYQKSQHYNGQHSQQHPPTPSPQPPYLQLQDNLYGEADTFAAPDAAAASSSSPPRPMTADGAAPPYAESHPMDQAHFSAPIPQSYQFSPLPASPPRLGSGLRYRRASSAGLLDAGLPDVPNYGAEPSASEAASGATDGPVFGLGLQMDPSMSLDSLHTRRLSEVHRTGSPIRPTFGLDDFDLGGGATGSGAGPSGAAVSPTHATFSSAAGDLGSEGYASSFHQHHHQSRRGSIGFPSLPGGLSSTLTLGARRRPSFSSITNRLLEEMEAEQDGGAHSGQQEGRETGTIVEMKTEGQEEA